jgi:molybdate transport system substrate-binding protein
LRALIRTFQAFALISAVSVSSLATSIAAKAQEPLVVFAAASLKDALDDAAKAFKTSDSTDVKLSYAGSLALARQLEQGAPADIFASADQDSMNYAVSKNSIKTDSRFDLLQNRLVFIAAKNSNIQSIGLTVDGLKQAVGTGRISTGEVNTVPVGKYAKAALQKLGLWSEVEPRTPQLNRVCASSRRSRPIRIRRSSIRLRSRRGRKIRRRRSSWRFCAPMPRVRFSRSKASRF